jgi:hypothetical protein
LAFSFDAPRMRVIIEYICSPARSLRSQPGSRRGGGAPKAAARPGTSSEARAGSSSTTLKMPGVPRSMEAPLAEQLGVLAALGQRGPRPVEAAVAQHRPAGLGDGPLEVPDRRQGLAGVGGRLGVERRVLVFDRVALAGDGPAGVALPHEPPGARGLRGGEQVVGALGAQPVGHRERLVEVAAEREAAQRGELVHDDVGPRAHDRLAQPGGVERVDDRRLGAHVVHGRGRTARAAGDVVAALDELGDEAASECAGRAGDEDA